MLIVFFDLDFENTIFL